MFSAESAASSVSYSHYFKRFLEMSGGSDNTRRVLFADESALSMQEVPAMVWARSGFPHMYRAPMGK